MAVTDSGFLTDATPSRASRTRSRLAALPRILWEDKLAFVGVMVLSLLVLAAIFAPWVAPGSPTQVNLSDRLIGPVWSDGGSWNHVLGTDALGRDVLARLIHGARVSLLIGAAVVVIGGTVGTVLGLIAGYKGGWCDTLIMRFADAQLAFPGLLLIIAVIAVLGPSTGVLIAVLSIYGWMIFARLVRGNVLQIREELYVRAATMAGAKSGRIMRRHLMPGVVSPLLTQSMLEFARIVLAEASLSYLGLGIQPPSASWGLMVAENQTYLATAWWTVVFPGVALALTVLATNLVASWLRVRSDPQQRQQIFAARFKKGQVS